MLRNGAGRFYVQSVLGHTRSYDKAFQLTAKNFNNISHLHCIENQLLSIKFDDFASNDSSRQNSLANPII